MSSESLDHQRAQAAARAVRDVFGEGTEADWKTYRSVVLNAASLLRQCGLIQTLAFWQSKKRDAETLLFGHVVRWLRAAPVTDAVVASSKELDGAIRGDRLPDAVLCLTDLKSGQVAVLEREAEAYVGWLKRLAEGRWLEHERKKAQAEGKP